MTWRNYLYLRRHTARLDDVPAPAEAIRLAFAGSHSRGAIVRNGSHLVTPEMEARLDAIAKHPPEFHFGRFDMRFEAFAEVQRGRGFKPTHLAEFMRGYRREKFLTPLYPATD